MEETSTAPATPAPSSPAPPVETCPACGNHETRLLFRASDRLYQMTEQEFQVVECRSCRLMRLSPRPNPAELRHYYPEGYWHVPGAGGRFSTLIEKYRRLVLRDHVRFVERAIKSSGAEGMVLDVGCGGGLFLKLMRDDGRQGIGLDFSLSAAGVAWEQNAVPATCASLANAPFADGSCAAITMFHVLEHLYDPASYLVASHHLLGENGRLVVQVPNAACWQFLVLGERWRGLEVPRHLWNFRTSDLEILLDRCGFEVIRAKHFSLRDNAACLATSIAPALDPTVRKVRGVEETPHEAMGKDLAYFGLVLASLPFALLESACGAGSTVIVEARKK